MWEGGGVVSDSFQSEDDLLRDMRNPMTDGVQGDYGCVHILPHEGGTNPINGVHGGVIQLV
jgi:hypothetical protein